MIFVTCCYNGSNLEIVLIFGVIPLTVHRLYVMLRVINNDFLLFTIRILCTTDNDLAIYDFLVVARPM